MKTIRTEITTSLLLFEGEDMVVAFEKSDIRQVLSVQMYSYSLEDHGQIVELFGEDVEELIKWLDRVWRS